VIGPTRDRVEKQMSETESKVPCSIVIPAFNESENIESCLAELKDVLQKNGIEHEIIVVDDGSTDGTREKLEKMEGIKLIPHETNRGYGRALKTGIMAAEYDYVVIIDADGSYNPSYIPELLGQAPAYEMVMGARLRETASLALLRTSVKWVIKKLASIAAGERIPDLNSGLRVFKKSITLKFFDILPDTYSWTATQTLALLSNGYRVKYVPIEYRKRGGRSKFHPVRDTANFMALVVRTVMYFNPLKFFLPVSLVLFLLSVPRMVLHVVTERNVKDSDVMLFITSLIVGCIGVLADLVVKQNRHRYMDLGG